MLTSIVCRRLVYLMICDGAVGLLAGCESTDSECFSRPALTFLVAQKLIRSGGFSNSSEPESRRGFEQAIVKFPVKLEDLTVASTDDLRFPRRDGKPSIITDGGQLAASDMVLSQTCRSEQHRSGRVGLNS